MEMELTKYEKRLMKSAHGIQRSVSLSMGFFIFSGLVLLAQLFEWRGFEGSSKNSIKTGAGLLFLSAFFHSYYSLQARHLKRLQSLEGQSKVG